MSEQSLQSTKKLGTFKLTMFAISTTLASGVFSLSGDFAANGAYTLATLIGWGICAVGMLGLAMCFFRLSVIRPELSSGIYSYSKVAYGEYVGFNVAWGYLLSVIITQVAFITMLFSALSFFFPVFGSGNNFASVAAGSIMVWGFAFLVLRGVNQAVGINTIVIIAKLLPILVAIVAVAMAGSFDFAIFTENFSGGEGSMSLFEQVRSTTYVTVWLFLGIEGAVVLSGRGETTKVAGKATAISVICLLLLYFVISFLSMGVLPQEELAALATPSLAGVLEAVVGTWGASLVNIAVIISIGGAMFSYTILAVDSTYGPAQNQCFPKLFTKLNKFGAPSATVLIVTIIVQAFIVLVYFSEATYQASYTLSTSLMMFPYALTTLFCLVCTIKGEGMKEIGGAQKLNVWLWAIIGTVYGVWLLYASGLTYILISALIYAPGTIVYLMARKDVGEKPFKSLTDKVVGVVLMGAFVASVVLIANGTLQPF